MLQGNRLKVGYLNEQVCKCCHYINIQQFMKTNWTWKKTTHVLTRTE